MKLRFTKMHSLGNDFVMINGVGKNIRITQDIARVIADRNFGIGCDQIIMVSEKLSDAKFIMQIFNQDGSEVGQCGNGARCFAKFLVDESLTNQSEIQVETTTTAMKINLNEDKTVTAELMAPIFQPSKIPLAVAQESMTYMVSTDMGEIRFSANSMGNPHCVILVDNLDCTDVLGIGELMESHEIFPERANIGFCELVSRSEIRLRVYERGVGETLGCGSGACAAVVAGIQGNRLDSKVEVNLPGGVVEVSWRGDKNPVYLTGRVHYVFDGFIEI